MPQNEIQELPFISSYHPKKIFSTDHTHSGFGVGDVKDSGSNDFTGTNSFSNETTFTNTNPITLEARKRFYDTKV